jgi:hypothetical protein
VLEVEAFVDLAVALLHQVLGGSDANQAWNLDPYAATSCDVFL